MRVLGIIPCRAGSERLPGKHLLECAGKPLLKWTFDAVAKSKSLSGCILSTNDPEVLEYADDEALGNIDIWQRSEELSGPNVSSEAVVIDILDRIEGQWDAICLLQATCPLRVWQDIDEAIGMLATSIWADAVISYCSAGSQYTLVTNGAIYLTRSDVVAATGSFFGRRWLPYIMPQVRSVDIDTATDLAQADRELTARQGMGII